MNIAEEAPALVSDSTLNSIAPDVKQQGRNGFNQVRLKYRADIDGLRAVAVLSVMAFHLDLAGFSGGFVGVDVFFVISGYLISAIVFAEISDGSYSVASFYERRIRRIFPALFAMLLTFSICALIFVFPSEMVDYAKSLLAAAASVSNLYFWQHSGYFDAPTSNPLLHTWSLAVEEQFYLAFPLYLWAVRKFFPHFLRFSVVFLFLASLVASALIVVHKPTTAFYMPYTRAWELLLGTLLSLGIFPKFASTWQRNLAALAGITAIGYSVIAYKSTTLFPGLSALLPCVGSALLIQGGESGKTVVGRFLSWRPVVFVGLISYSLYLWHWPIIILHKMGILLAMSTTLPASLINHISQRRYDELIDILVSFVFAILSWRFIERPFRNGSLRLKGRPLFLAAAATIAAFVCFSSYAIYSGGIHGRLSPEAEQVASYSSSIKSAGSSLRRGVCFLTPEYSMSNFDDSVCLSEVGGRRNFLLLGDSHSATLWPGLSQRMSSANIMQSSVSACRPILHPGGSVTCRQMMEHIFRDFLSKNPVQGLILEARWEPGDMTGLTATIEWARRRQIPVILVGPVPEYDAPLPRLLGYSIAWHESSYAGQHRSSQPALLDLTMRSLARSTWHVPYLSLFDAICHAGECAEYADPARTIPMLADGDHFTEPGSIYVVQRLIDEGALR